MEEGSTDSESIVIETLRSRGWSLGDVELVKAIIMIHSALADDASTVVDSVESELVNTDLKSIGDKSLPDPTLLRNRKSSHILGPKVLQISSVRDITKSSIEDVSRSSSSRRLLKLGLTDGHTEITAIEFAPVPSVPDDLVPGAKVRLEDKATIRSGIVCLNPKVLSFLGGVVQPLYEAWQMNQKYSGFSRSSLRLSRESDTGGPPPFEKLQIRAPSCRFVQQGKSSDYAGSSSKSHGPNAVTGNTDFKPTGRKQKLDKSTDMIWNPKAASVTERTEEKPSSVEMRPKEDYAGSSSKSHSPNPVTGNTDFKPTGRKQKLDKSTDMIWNPKAASVTERTEEKPSSAEMRPKEDYAGSTSKSHGPNAVVGNTDFMPTGRQQNLDKLTDMNRNPKTSSVTERTEEKPSSSETRPKEVVEFVPVQNQAATQKLLQKMNHQSSDGRHSKGQRHRGKGKQEEPAVLTLDEWEKIKAEEKTLKKDELPDIRRDEHLAWQLQNEFDSEDSHVQRGPHKAGADDLRMSMFNYTKDDGRFRASGHGGGGRGRGRGRGKGKGKWKERERGSGRRG
ncbi:hypothetical protein F2P56_023080 [Juglans regia]|uniref:RecQ mediated genome instability protein 1 OB-fold domain-containing protein n=2 Tax=Juglans regia TaxID=51240 RepID=A0A833UCY9_JUGRE|nr:tudor domain-containing protein 3 [Juglans regia]KAF5459094.1 hypothetical protein F2P56_023080 [Juglans regia]